MFVIFLSFGMLGFAVLEVAWLWRGCGLSKNFKFPEIFRDFVVRPGLHDAIFRNLLSVILLLESILMLFHFTYQHVEVVLKQEHSKSYSDLNNTHNVITSQFKKVRFCLFNEKKKKTTMVLCCLRQPWINPQGPQTWCSPAQTLMYIFYWICQAKKNSEGSCLSCRERQ